MPIDSSVAELLTAQLFVLVQEAPDPIFFYINSTGIAVRSTPRVPWQCRGEGDLGPQHAYNNTHQPSCLHAGQGWLVLWARGCGGRLRVTRTRTRVAANAGRSFVHPL